MRTTFRQGIARYQTDISANPIFLQKSAGAGNFIDLLVQPDPTIIIFAHRNANYVVEEPKTVTHAWGPFSGTTTQYLYWDVNVLTGALTRGITTAPPIYSASAPVNPAEDQHWFDTTETVMRYRSGSKWVECIRVFAGYLSSGSIIRPYGLGSQAGIVGDYEAGNLVLDSYGMPLRQYDGTFVTSVTTMTIVNSGSKTVRFEAEMFYGLASEPIPKFSFVQLKSGNQLELARSTDYLSRIAGIVSEDLYTNEVGYITTDGIIRNEQWNWPADKVNRPVFCGQNGEVTLTPPTDAVLQIAGFVYSADSIYLDVQPALILIDTDSILPEPTPPVPPGVPTTDFSANVTAGQAPLTVTFTSTSLGSPTTFAWDFTNDGVTDASTPTATFTYAVPGTYNVRLRTSNAFGWNELTKTSFIQVAAASNAGGQNTNLGIALGGPSQITRSQQFSISTIVSNSGYLDATGVARKLYIPHVNGEIIVVSNLPIGSTTSVDEHKTTVNLPIIPVVASNEVEGPSFITVMAPTQAGLLTIQADVYSPDVDAEVSDNTTSISIEVLPS